MWLRETGVLTKMKYDVLKQAIPNPLPKVWKDQPLNLYQLEIIMIVFGVGISSSLLAFFYELRKTYVSNRFQLPNLRGKYGEKKVRKMARVDVGGRTRDNTTDTIEIVDVTEIVQQNVN